MMTEDKILLTARYEEGDLTETERIAFEQELLNDVGLQEQLQNYRAIHQSLKMQLANDASDASFKNTLKDFNAQYFAQETKVISFKPALKWMGAIAAVLVVALFVWAPWNGNLYQQYQSNDQMLVAERGEVKETDLAKAAAFYNEKDYTSAKQLLEKLAQQQPANAMIGYYYGQTLLQTNEIVQGRTKLTAVYNGESVFKYDSAYAIALSYLKTNEKENCKTWLLKIPLGNIHYPQAKDLLEKLTD